MPCAGLAAGWPGNRHLRGMHCPVLVPLAPSPPIWRHHAHINRLMAKIKLGNKKNKQYVGLCAGYKAVVPEYCALNLNAVRGDDAPL